MRNKRLNEKYRGSGFDHYRGVYTRFSMVNQNFLDTVKTAIGYPQIGITKEPDHIDQYGRFSFSGENAITYEITVIAPDFYEIKKDADSVEIWRGAGEEDFVKDLQDAKSSSIRESKKSLDEARSFSKKDMQDLIEKLTGSTAISLKSSFKDGKLKMSGVLETGKGYDSDHTTQSGKYSVVNGELAINKGKYYNSMRGLYMTNWARTGIKLPAAMKNDIKEVEYNFEQDLD